LIPVWDDADVATDVVVIGGGYVGLASAIALAERGASVVLIERGLPGAANAVAAPGGIRQQFGTEVNVRLAVLSAPTWDTFEQRFGVDPLFRRVGYLFLARSQAQAAELAQQVEMQHELGVDSEYLDRDEIGTRWPTIAARGFLGGAFRQGDGWSNQHRVVDGLVRGARAAGVDVRVGTEALRLELSGGGLRGVRTSLGRISSDAVLVATGAWGASLLGPLGIDLPVLGRRHELLLVEPTRPYPAGLPWLIGVDDAVHTRADVDGLALVGGFLGVDRAVDPDAYETRADPTWAAAVLETVDRVFGLAGPDARIHRGWAGLYPGTPDRHPIIDRVADGVFVALGFAGTGLMLAPGAGLLATELIVDGKIRSMEPIGLAASRFAAAGVPTETTGF
jgi:sarcosine oxidase subunit beta